MMRAMIARRPGRLAGTAGAILALGTVAPAWAQPEDQQPPASLERVGLITLGRADSPLSRLFFDVGGSLLHWVGAEEGGGLAALAESLKTGDGGGFWIRAGATGMLELDAGDGIAPGAFLLDVSLDSNLFRTVSAQPFSRTPRGRALDALAIDNTRRARLAVAPMEEGAEHPLAMVLFTESRSEPPGRWRAIRLGGLREAPILGSAPPPLEIDLGPMLSEVLFTGADLALALEPGAEPTGPLRFEEWGGVRTTALRTLAETLSGRTWLWREGEGLVLALPLKPRAAQRDAGRALGVVLGKRLSWTRDEPGRATGEIRFEADAAGAEPDALVRLITVAGRSALVLSGDRAALDAAPAMLADLRWE